MSFGLKFLAKEELNVSRDSECPIAILTALGMATLLAALTCAHESTQVLDRLTECQSAPIYVL